VLCFEKVAEWSRISDRCESLSDRRNSLRIARFIILNLIFHTYLPTYLTFLSPLSFCTSLSFCVSSSLFLSFYLSFFPSSQTFSFFLSFRFPSPAQSPSPPHSPSMKQSDEDVLRTRRERMLQAKLRKEQQQVTASDPTATSSSSSSTAAAVPSAPATVTTSAAVSAPSSFWVAATTTATPGESMSLSFIVAISIMETMNLTVILILCYFNYGYHNRIIMVYISLSSILFLCSLFLIYPPCRCVKSKDSSMDSQTSRTRTGTVRDTFFQTQICSAGC
jgi:hypothetical protein